MTWVPIIVYPCLTALIGMPCQVGDPPLRHVLQPRLSYEACMRDGGIIVRFAGAPPGYTLICEERP